MNCGMLQKAVKKVALVNRLAGWGRHPIPCPASLVRLRRLPEACAALRICVGDTRVDMTPEEAGAEFMAGAQRHAEALARSYRDAAADRLAWFHGELENLVAPTQEELDSVDAPEAAAAVAELVKAILDAVQNVRGWFEQIDMWSNDPTQRQHQWLMGRVANDKGRQQGQVHSLGSHPAQARCLRSQM